MAASPPSPLPIPSSSASPPDLPSSPALIHFHHNKHPSPSLSPKFPHGAAAAATAVVYPHGDDYDIQNNNIGNHDQGNSPAQFPWETYQLPLLENIDQFSSPLGSSHDIICNLQHPVPAVVPSPLTTTCSVPAFDPFSGPPPLPPPSCRGRRREPGYTTPRRCDRRVLKSILSPLWSTFFPSKIDGGGSPIRASSAGNAST